MTRFAFVFPGQGSQRVGMLDAWAGDEAVQATLAETEDVLGADLPALIAAGPAEQLDLTINTQPAMLAADVALWRAWRARGGAAPAVVAGHSLGEFAALVAAGVLAFDDALRLVRLRAEAMQAAVPEGEGGMAAIIGLDDDAVRALCADNAGGDVLEPVNFNAPGQVVIAGSARAVGRAVEAARPAGARMAKALPVSVPSHSALMRPAAEALTAAMAGIEFAPPQIAVRHNIDAAPAGPAESIRRALARQVCEPVQWVSTQLAMRDADGVEAIVECGPGGVLAGLAKRTVKGLALHAIATPDAMDAAIAALQE